MKYEINPWPLAIGISLCLWGAIFLAAYAMVHR